MTTIRCAICREPLPRELAAGPTHRAICPDRRKEAPAPAPPRPVGASLRGPGRESTATGTGHNGMSVSPAARDHQAPA